MKEFYNYKTLLLLFCILGIHYSFAQPQPFDSAYVDSVTSRLSKMPDDTSKVNHLINLASMYLTKNQTLSVRYANEGEKLADKINFHEGQINSIAQSSFLYAISGEWPKALHRIQDGVKLADQYMPAKLIFFYNIMFIVAANKGDPQLAKDYIQKAYHHPLFSNLNYMEQWGTYMQLGLVYEWADQLDSAQYFADKLKGFLVKYGSSKYTDGIAHDTYILLGNIAFKRNQLDQSINYHWQAGYHLGLAYTYKSKGQQDSAISHASKALQIGMVNKNPREIIESSKLLADFYAKTNAVLSNKYLNIYVEAKDSLLNVQKMRQMEDIRLNEQKSDFELQKKETADRNRYVLGFLLIVILFVTIFSVFLYKNNRQKQKAKLKIENAYKELRETQAQLIQSEKMASLGELTAGIAHEIQNPLNFVNNFSEVNKELLIEMKDEIERGNINEATNIANSLIDNQEKINHHGKRADAIVKGMMQHSRSSNSLKVSTDINALADEYLRLAYHGMRGKDNLFNATIKTDFDDKIDSVNIIPQDIGRVFLNLYNNAFYAVNEKKKVAADTYQPTVSVTIRFSLSTRGEGRGEVIISVKDNGNGIPQNIVDKIFQPFFTTKPTGQGTGLGLSLSYDIIKAHGGEIKVETKEGVGSEFIVQLSIPGNYN